jgi:hypothetical protein
MTCVDNLYKFTDSKYGDVIIYLDKKYTEYHPAYKHTDEVDILAEKRKNQALEAAPRIYRKFSGDESLWRYVPPLCVSEINLLLCFEGDDFCVWVSEDGRIIICPKEYLNKISYRTDASGYLCDMERLERGETLRYIQFYGSRKHPSVLKSFNLEELGNMLSYHDGKGKVGEIAIPRYVDESGNMLRFIRRGVNWVLASNPSYKVVTAPHWSIGGEQAPRNPLLGYNNAIWLEGSTGVFKCLLPEVTISRTRGMTHLIDCEFLPNYSMESNAAAGYTNNGNILGKMRAKIRSDTNFFGSARFGEVSLYANDFDFSEVNMRPNNTLGALRLAQIFQTQGEYELALRHLGSMFTRGPFSGEETKVLSSIIKWFIPKIGHEQNSLAASVTIKALWCLMQSDLLGDDCKRVFRELTFYAEDKILPPDIVVMLTNDLQGFDLLPRQMQMSPKEELIFWYNVEVYLGILSEEAKNDMVLKNRLDRVLNMAIRRVKDLTLIIDRPEGIASATEKEKRLFSFATENMAFGTSIPLFDPNAVLENQSGPTGNELPRTFESQEEKVGDAIWKLVEKIYASSAVESDGEGQQSSAEHTKSSEAVKFPILADGNQLRSSLRKFIEDFNDELENDARELQAAKKDPSASEILTHLEDIESVQKIIESSVSSARKSAEDAASAIIKFANAGRLEMSKGTDTWQAVKMPTILRAYGMICAGDSGRRRALKYLKDQHPWFLTEEFANDFDHFIELVETYVPNVTTSCYLCSLQNTLNSLVSLNARADASETWKNFISQFDKIRKNPLETRARNPELFANSLLFELMTGIRPREDQVEKNVAIVNEISGSGDEPGILIQQIMGSGKTEVLMPFLIVLMLNRTGNFPIIVSHDSQMPAVELELPNILQSVGIRLNVIKIDSDALMQPKGIRHIREIFELAFANRDVVPALTSNFILSLRTTFRSLCSKPALKFQQTRLEFHKFSAFGNNMASRSWTKCISP